MVKCSAGYISSPEIGFLKAVGGSRTFDRTKTKLVFNVLTPVEPATTHVADAHKEGLAVYAAGFASDIFSSYNYSYDLAAEYLQLVDNSRIAIDFAYIALKKGLDIISTINSALNKANLDQKQQVLIQSDDTSVTDVIDPPLPPVNDRARKDSDKGSGGGSSESGQRRVSVDAVATTLMLIRSVYVLLW
ncbi:hypothetical protein Tco_0554648 [Tanacetum coccineum]